MSQEQLGSERFPLVVGEVLFDEFPDGRRVLGGAPFNVAWNLQGIGDHPMLISTVGDDILADQIEKKMNAWGMRLDSLQRKRSLETGHVTVLENTNGPGYEIAENQSFDHTEYRAVDGQQITLLYHGSLGWRGKVTRETIRQHRIATQAPVFVDLNIREPWFNLDWLPDLLANVSWLKLNRDELKKVSRQEISNDDELRDSLKFVRDRYQCSNFFVTDGEHGAYSFDASDQLKFAATPKVKHVVDTVGAGDAFASVAIHGLLKGWNNDEILERAVNFAAKICSIRGATSEDKTIYRL